MIPGKMKPPRETIPGLSPLRNFEKETRKRRRKPSVLTPWYLLLFLQSSAEMPFGFAYALHNNRPSILPSIGRRCMDRKSTDPTSIFSLFAIDHRRLSYYYDGPFWFSQDDDTRPYPDTETRLLASYGDRNNHDTDSTEERRSRKKEHYVKNHRRYEDNSGGNSYCTAKRNWLERSTSDICNNDTTDLSMGKWYQALSLLHAWSQFRKVYPPTALRMEALLNVLRKAQERNANIVLDDLEIFNTILNAWTCAAIFQKDDEITPLVACGRAKDIVRFLQRNGTILPNEYSFDIVLHSVLKVEGALQARRFLAWMEYLYKTGKNQQAKPSSGDYVQILLEYAKLPSKQSGPLADGFLTHMEYLHDNDPSLEIPTTMCYNIAIKAWGNARKCGLSGREVAEQADRTLDQMKRRNLPFSRPDKFTYSSCISMWAASGMKSHAVNRVEQILREMEENDVEPNTVILNSVMNAYTQSRKVGAVERTAELLEVMENSPENADLRPDLASYNTHLHALAVNASPQRPELSFQAQVLVERMMDRFREGKLASQPNLFSYNLVLKSMLNARTPEVTLRMTQFLRMLTQHVQPDVTTFNGVLSSFSVNGRPSAAQKALDLLRYMEVSYHSGRYPKARPDATSFAKVIQAYAKSDEVGAHDRAQALFDEMIDRANNSGETHLKPNKECYIALIECWAKSQTGTRGARQAEALMNQMIQRFEAGEHELAPPLKTFNAILHAWAFSGTRGSGYQAEKQLNSMWAKFHAGKTAFRPNKVSYNTVIKAIAKSKNERKAQKALQILRRMEQLYKAGNMDARPDEWSYAAVLNSCADPSVPDPRIRRKALDTALFTLKEIQNNSAYGKPTEVIYGTFIRACVILLDENDALRPTLIRAVFQQCVTDGQVGRLVLQNIPKELFAELLPTNVMMKNKESIDLEDLPKDWCCNVQTTTREY